MNAWRPDQPYDDLPLLPPNLDLETKPILKECIEARAALAELKQAADLVPNPAILISTLPLLEAQKSTAIENIVTTADRLFEHVRQDANADAATREALRYRHALLEGYGSLTRRPLATATAEQICTRIKDKPMKVRKVPGTALANQRTGEIIYTPPVGESRIRDLLSNWEKFLHGSDDCDPLIRLAVAHYQFEAIHPFTDGNGRTGRVINSLYLVQAGLLPLPILYLSRHILANRSSYYELLLDVTQHLRWEPWILFVLRGVRETARWTVAKISRLRELTELTRDHVRDKLPKIYSHELVDLLAEQPYCRIANVVEAGIAKRQAAATYLSALVDIGVLQVTPRGREKLFLNTRLLRLLTEEGDEIEAFRD